MNIFDGLPGYEKLMLICGFILFVLALAKARSVLGQPQKAQANVDAALRLNPNIKINAAVRHAARMGSRPTER